MKTIEEWIYIWADDWHDTWRLIEAVRAEAMSQARREALEEASALLRKQAAETDTESEYTSRIMVDCAAEIEAFAKETK